MESSPDPRKYSETPPPPSIATTRKAITDLAIRRAISVYRVATRVRDETVEACADDRELSSVQEYAELGAVHAEDALVRAIRRLVPSAGAGGRADDPDRAYGVRCDGTLYLATTSNDDGAGLVHLAMIDEVDIADVGTLGDDPVYLPDGRRLLSINDPDPELEAEDDDDEE